MTMDRNWRKLLKSKITVLESEKRSLTIVDSCITPIQEGDPVLVDFSKKRQEYLQQKIGRLKREILPDIIA